MSTLMSVSLIFAFFFSFSLVEGLSFNDMDGTVSLTISQGELLGKRINSYDNRTGYGFMGVPFGAPAVGPLRFAKPVPAPEWEGVRDATVKRDACPAVGELTYKKPEGGPMSEDCLHAYVYSSKNCLTKGGCPIMWVLHGGKYNFESPVIFVDDVIVHNFASDGQDVVVVIPAYRLENFGFLNIAPGMNTSVTPNAAMWDLLLALQWTRREAAHFGGDPNRITIFGHSAGAQFADVISTSPHFAGLFSQLVLMSGADTAYEAGVEANSLASWVTATLLGCADENTDRSDAAAVEKVVECIRSKTWEEIVDANRALNNYPEDYHGPHADGPGGILPLSPKMLSSSRAAVPVLLGTTSAEFMTTKYALNADGTADLTKVAELCEVFSYATAFANPLAMTKKCLDYYMQGKNVMSLNQDTMFLYPSFVAAREFARKGVKVYAYSFTYKGVGEAFQKYSTLEEEDHPSHSEDYVYILGMHRNVFAPKDYEIEKIYSGIFLNFVKTGSPSPGDGQPAWEPFSEAGREYYQIDFDDDLKMPGMKKGYNDGAVKLWVDDGEKYGGPVIQPSQFPPHIDRIDPMDVGNAYASHHLNRTTAHDKTLEVMNDLYKIWIDFVNTQRYKHMLGSKNFRSISVEQQDLTEVAEPPSNHLIEILLICFFVVLVFVLLHCCLHCVRERKERKGYEQF